VRGIVRGISKASVRHSWRLCLSVAVVSSGTIPATRSVCGVLAPTQRETLPHLVVGELPLLIVHAALRGVHQQLGAAAHQLLGEGAEARRQRGGSQPVGRRRVAKCAGR
jgi:hypothetical protein